MGAHVPAELRMFLTAAAIFDDIDAAPAPSGSGARHHTGSANLMVGGSSRTTSRQREPRS
jgi:hypothetical protein